MNELKLVYESQGAKNYICMETEAELSKYQVKMLECSEVPGILKMHRTVMNGVHKLNFDITKMSRLKDVLQNKELKGQATRKLLLDILETILGAEDYFLSFNRFVLEPEYVFIGSDHKIGLLYLPYQNKELVSTESVRSFYQTLLVEYLTEDNDVFFLMLLKYINKQDFSIAGLLEKLKEGVTAPAVEKAPTSIRLERPVEVATEKNKPVFQPGILKQLKPENKDSSVLELPKEEKAVKEPAPAKTDAKASSDFGFVIPGMKADSPKKESEPAKQEKEKKSSLFGSLISGIKTEKESTGGLGAIFQTPSKVSAPTPVKQTTPSGTYIPPVNQTTSEKPWQGTVMLDAEESTHTIMLDAESNPHLQHNGTVVELDHFPFNIGRQAGMDYVIAKSAISQRHASIHRVQDKYYIKDENSSNHTYVNGKQIPPFTECEISAGDVIRLANEEMTFTV